MKKVLQLGYPMSPPPAGPGSPGSSGPDKVVRLLLIQKLHSKAAWTDALESNITCRVHVRFAVRLFLPIALGSKSQFFVQKLLGLFLFY